MYFAIMAAMITMFAVIDWWQRRRMRRWYQTELAEARTDARERGCWDHGCDPREHYGAQS